MAQTTLFLSARSVLDLASALNAFLVAQPLTLWVQDISISVQDLEQYDGVEVRCCVQYDPTGGVDYGTRFTIERYTSGQLPLLQQNLNDAIAAAVGTLWFTLPLIAIETEARLPQYTAFVLRHDDPAAAENISYFSLGGGPVPPPPGPEPEEVIHLSVEDTPYDASANEVLIVDTTLGPFDLMLPDATAVEGLKVRVMRLTSNASYYAPVFATPSVAGQLINDDAGPLTIPGNRDCYTFISDGIGWWVIGQVLGASFP